MSSSIFLARKHAATRCGISLPILDKLIREGKLDVVRVGRRVLVRRESLERLGRPSMCKRHPVQA
ncbi:MAG: excisionase family DNA-binding protein [Betaproteobacteria bacterium]|nr:excisionase family DNA-binding protein [Betaproteobacteria bacterium]